MKKMKSKGSVVFAIVILILIIGYIAVAMFLPMPKIDASPVTITPVPIIAQAVSYPQYGESAIGAVGYGVIGTNGEQKSVPIASIAKTILALAVLKEKPLQVGEQGPSLIMTQTDIDLYKSNLAQNGSVVPIALDEQLSEYQLLQALLIPSGDNIADTLVNWVFGSMENYLKYANQYLTDLELKETHVADASGLSPQSVSSAQNLVKLGEIILKEPVLAEIVGQAKVNLPVLGDANNYNTLLGQNGVIGIKTGNTDEAGGCLLSAYKSIIDGQEMTFVLAILGASDRAKVLNDTKSFIKTNNNAFKFVTFVSSGQVVGSYNTPWGKKINAVAQKDTKILVAGKEQISIKADLRQAIKSLNTGTEMGTITVTTSSNTYSSPVILETKLSVPPFFWKLFHP